MRSLIVGLFAGIVLSLAHSTQAGPPGGQGGRGGNPPSGGTAGGLNGPGPPSGQGGGGPPGKAGRGAGAGMIQQLMALDVNGDGALTPTEVTDPRVQTMLQQADADANGAVTLAELTSAMNNQNHQGGGRGGRGGRGNQGGPPRPCEVMPGFVQDQLQLTDTQRQQIAALQAQVDAQVTQILTTQQLQQLAAGPQGPPMEAGPGQPGQPGQGPGNGQGKNGRSAKGGKQ